MIIEKNPAHNQTIIRLDEYELMEIGARTVDTLVAGIVGKISDKIIKKHGDSIEKEVDKVLATVGKKKVLKEVFNKILSDIDEKEKSNDK